MAVIVLLLAVAGCGRVRHPARDQARRHAIHDALTRILDANLAPTFVGRDRVARELWQLTRKFYQKRDAAPAWFDGASPAGRADDLIAELRGAPADGLDPVLYDAELVGARRAALSDANPTVAAGERAAEFDVWLTYSYLRFAHDLAHGVGNLSSADPSWRIRGTTVDLTASLDDAIAHDRVAVSLRALAPANPQYEALRQALGRYRQLAAAGGWRSLPDGTTLKPGESGEVVSALARRLKVTGDYTGPVDGLRVYDATLRAGVERFQRRHGLEPDGVVGPTTVAALNVPADARVSQIELNLERWRWLPRDLGARHIFVNIPEYRLELWDHGRLPLTMPVIVGKDDTPTPIFDDDMTYLVFAPYWNVPPDIAERETLPAIMSDPAFLERTNMEVLDRDGRPVDPEDIDVSNPGAYRFRQKPGAQNSLGLVKFMFPNQYNVYLHDTPADSLFARATRSFSHGCVRLAEPEKLAAYILRDQPEWTTDRIDAAMHGTDQTIVRLREKIPVYLVYFTARVSADGEVQFRRDIYGIDGRQAARVRQVVTALRRHALARADALQTPGSAVSAAF